MVAPLETTSAQQMLNFRLPRAAAGRLRLTVPGDVEIRSGADVAARTSIAPARRHALRAAARRRRHDAPDVAQQPFAAARAGGGRPLRAGRRSDRGLREAARHGYAGGACTARWTVSASSCPRASRSPRSPRRSWPAGTWRPTAGRKVANVRCASRRPRPWCWASRPCARRRR